MGAARRESPSASTATGIQLDRKNVVSELDI